MDLTLVRHAQAERSGDDPPLTARGRQQAALLAERAKRWKAPTAVLASPSLRAQQTAAPLCEAVGATLEIEAWLAEVDAPGTTANLDATRAAEQISAAAMSELRSRTASGLEALLALHGGRASDARLVLVGHGMALAVALEVLLGIETVPWAGHRFQFPHAGFAAVRAFPFSGDFVFGLVRYAEIDHVPREIRTY